MAVLSRDSVFAPTLRRETVPVPSLNGDVIVRGLKLSERLRLRGLAQDAAGSANPDRFVSELLAVAVVDADGNPFWSADEWDIWGSGQVADYGVLVDKALQLGGFDGAAAKNG